MIRKLIAGTALAATAMIGLAGTAVADSPSQPVALSQYTACTVDTIPAYVRSQLPVDSSTGVPFGVSYNPYVGTPSTAGWNQISWAAASPNVDCKVWVIRTAIITDPAAKTAALAALNSRENRSGSSAALNTR